MREKLKKLGSIFIVLTLLLNYIFPITTVFATTVYVINFTATGTHTMKVDGGVLKIDGQTLVLEDNSSNVLGTPECESTTSCSITVSGTTPTKLNYNAADKFKLYNTNEHTLYDMTTYYNTNNVFMVEDFNDQNEGNDQPHYIEGGTLTTGNFSYNNSGDGDPIDIWLNGTAIGVGEAPPASKDYYYVVSSGTVTFDLTTLINNRLTSVTINGVDYSSQIPTTNDGWLEANEGQMDKVSITVPYSTTYNIVTTSTHNFEWSIGNFLWSRDEKDINNDDYMGHGHLELVKIKYKGVEYTPEQMAALNKSYLDWKDDGDVGSAVLPKGSEVKVKLKPENGYQLTSFTINGGVFTPGENVGEYTFTIPSGNFHLGAHFTKVADKVNSESDSITSGNITLSSNESSMAVGTARLDVKDVDLTQNQISNFKNAAGTYNISNYLDISLYNTVYKGSADSVWDTQVTELDHKARITLKLADDVNGRDVVIVHEKHDGTYEVIETTYDPVTNTISFLTDSFSNYAIATKEVASMKNPKTWDNITLYFSILGVSSVMLVSAYVFNKKENQ